VQEVVDDVPATLGVVLEQTCLSEFLRERFRFRFADRARQEAGEGAVGDEPVGAVLVAVHDRCAPESPCFVACGLGLWVLASRVVES
jgi:hypothetical protein